MGGQRMHALKDFGSIQKLCNIKSMKLLTKCMLLMVSTLVAMETSKVIMDVYNSTMAVMVLMSRWKTLLSKVTGFIQHLWYLQMNHPKEKKMLKKKKELETEE